MSDAPIIEFAKVNNWFNGFRPLGGRPRDLHGPREIVEANTPEAFFNHPKCERTRDFLSKILAH